jgi:hypothetical protein
MYVIPTSAGRISGRRSPGHPQPSEGPGSRIAGIARWPRPSGGDNRDPGPGLLLVPITYGYVLGDG